MALSRLFRMNVFRLVCFFFFQAEDGIRDVAVTGVQTCALPIFSKELLLREQRRYFRHPVNLPVTLKAGEAEQQARMTNLSGGGMAVRTVKPLKQIGRAHV